MAYPSPVPEVTELVETARRALARLITVLEAHTEATRAFKARLSRLGTSQYSGSATTGDRVLQIVNPMEILQKMISDLQTEYHLDQTHMRYPERLPEIDTQIANLDRLS